MQIDKILNDFPTTVSKWCTAYNKERVIAIKTKKKSHKIFTGRSLNAEKEK